MKRKTQLREIKKANARWQILKKVFANFYSISDKTVEDAKNILKPHADIIAAQWRYLVKTDPWKPDLRCGYETYGYKDDESIMYNLQYISDRWNCTFRLRWTLDLINQ
jgi:hypothetical protein